MDKPLISLVMIVKDEAAILRETLERVRSIVDEWVIVDTGSTDDTRAIISEYGSVTELPFEDFVTTKNKALALATGEYILFMDADERLLAGAETLRAVAEAGEWDAVSGRIVVSSPWHRNYTIQRYGHGVDARKLHVINLGIRRELFAGRLARKLEAGRPLQAVYSSNPDRGLQELAAMWPEIATALTAHVPGLRLVVTYGWEGLRTWDTSPEWQARCDQVEAEVRGRFAGQDVIFTGRLSKPALARVLMQSDVCLYPCNFFETFCLTALECQAAGVPMVTSEFGALATTLAGGAGVKIPGHPSSALYRRQFVRAAVDVLQDADRRRAMGAAGLAHVTGGPFGWLDVAEQWRRLGWEF